MTNDNERIRQLEDEVSRLSLIAESKRAERAHELFCAWLQGGCQKIDCDGKYHHHFVALAVKMETALLEQAERERLGLGKLAEMANAHETAPKAG